MGYASEQENFETVLAEAVPIDQLDFSAIVGTLARYEPRIIVLLLPSGVQARQFLADGWDGGLITSSTVVLGTSQISGSALFKADPTIENAQAHSSVRQALNTIAFIGLQVANNDWRAYDRGKAFIRRYISQPNTVGATLPNGKVSCLNTTDDSGDFYLYKSCDSKGKCVCTGQDFSKYKADGSNIGALYLLPYVYDSTMALAFAIGNLSQQSDGTIVVPNKISGRALKNTLVNNISFNGITGSIAFSKGRSCAANFGRGDRSTGLRYAVVNLQGYSRDDDLKGLGLKRVATWSTEAGYTSCDEDTVLQDATLTNVTGGCHLPVQYGSNPDAASERLFSAPLDRPAPTKVGMSRLMRGILVALATLQMCFVVSISACFIVNHKKRLVKASQATLMALVLLASAIGVARILLFSTPPSDATCNAGFWTGHLAFVLGVSSLFVKTLRVHLLVNPRRIRRVVFTLFKALCIVGFIVASVCIYISVVISVYPLHRVTSSSTDLTGLRTYVDSCANGQHVFTTILYAFEALLLSATTKLCYDTKDVPDAINETKSILLGMYDV
jgi:hypothetical protein